MYSPVLKGTTCFLVLFRMVSNGRGSFLRKQTILAIWRKLCRIELSETEYAVQILQILKCSFKYGKGNKNRIMTSAKISNLVAKIVHFVRSDCSSIKCAH